VLHLIIQLIQNLILIYKIINQILNILVLNQIMTKYIIYILKKWIGWMVKPNSKNQWWQQFKYEAEGVALIFSYI
jgi:hypothetical protein